MIGTRQKVMGVGCFAAEPTLARVLRKMVAAYCLDDWQTAMADAKDRSEGCRTLHRLISGAPASAGINAGSGADEKIAGFFLGFENHRLKLALFTRRSGRKFLKYTATLDELAALRRKRLH